MLVEYIRSLTTHHIDVKHFIHELIINALVSNNCCYQLHQFLQYHVVKDSVHVACILLSLEPKYPPIFQLALDMLKRLNTYEEIVEVLLLKDQVMSAVRVVNRDGKGMDVIKGVSAARFLEAATRSGDDLVRILAGNTWREKSNADSPFQ